VACCQVTAATTQTMLLLTSAASTIVYAQLGDIPWDCAAVLLPLAFLVTLAGQFAIDWLVQKVSRHCHYQLLFILVWPAVCQVRLDSVTQGVSRNCLCGCSVWVAC